MPRLVLQFEGRILQQQTLGAAVTIGRLPDNGMVIDNPAVSGRHARVFREGDAFVVEDLHSTNGTFVNGKRVTRQTLSDGDILLVGKHNVVFEKAGGDEATAVDADAPSLPDLGGTMYLDTRQHRKLMASLEPKAGEPPAPSAPAVPPAHAAPSGSAAAPPASVPPAPAAAPARGAAAGRPKKVGSLRVVSGRADREEYRLQANTTLIGKSDNATVRLKGWFKPKVAVAIARTGDRYVATHLGGKALVNDEPLKGRRDLRDGDVLQVSGLVLQFSLADEGHEGA